MKIVSRRISRTQIFYRNYSLKCFQFSVVVCRIYPSIYETVNASNMNHMKFNTGAASTPSIEVSIFSSQQKITVVRLMHYFLPTTFKMNHVV